MALREELKRRWRRATALHPRVHRVYADTRYFGRIRTEQMESFRQAKLIRDLYRRYPHVKRSFIRLERPDRFQRFERRRFRSLTSILEHFTVG